MSELLEGCVLAVLATDGVVRKRLDELQGNLRALGARVHLVALQPGELRAGDGTVLSPAATIADVSAGYYDGIVVPDLGSSADLLAEDDEVVALLQLSAEDRKPIACVGRGLALLADAAVISGLRVACDPELLDAVREAEGIPASEPVAWDRNVTSGTGRCDLRVLCERFALGVHARRTELIDERSEESFPASDAHSGATALHD